MPHPLEKARVWSLHTGHTLPSPYVRIKCDVCGVTANHNVKVNTPPNAVASWFKKQGWKIKGEGKRAKCPECVQAKREPLVAAVQQYPDAFDHGAPPPPPPGVPLTPTELEAAIHASQRVVIVQEGIDKAHEEYVQVKEAVAEEDRQEVEAEQARQKAKALKRKKATTRHSTTPQRRKGTRVHVPAASDSSRSYERPVTTNLASKMNAALNGDKPQESDLDNLFDDSVDTDLARGIQEDLSDNPGENGGRSVVQEIIERAVAKADLPLVGADVGKATKGAHGMVGRTHKPKRRSFTDAFKLDVLDEHEAAAKRGKGQDVLDKHNIYHSRISEWKKARSEGRLKREHVKTPAKATPQGTPAKANRRSVLATVKQQRALFALLEENFDDDVGIYADSWSDERIAKEIGVDIDIVEQQRNSAFGELQDSALLSIEATLDKLGTEFNKEVTDLQELLNTVVRSFTERFTELNAEIKALKDR